VDTYQTAHMILMILWVFMRISGTWLCSALYLVILWITLT